MRRFLTILQDGLKGKPLSLRSPHWHTVRKHYLEQHNKCAACGRTEHLQVHHIEPFHLHPDKELDINNMPPEWKSCEAQCFGAHRAAWLNEITGELFALATKPSFTFTYEIIKKG